MELEVLRTGIGILDKFIMEYKARLSTADFVHLADAYRIMVNAETDMLLELRQKTKTRGVDHDAM